MSISGLGGSPFAGTRGAFQPPSFDSLDTNKDGSVTLDELEAAAPGGASATSNARTQQLFKAMDADGNGSVSTDEKSAFDQKVQSHHGGHHHGGGELAFLAQQLSSTSDTDALAATDTNGDGSVSLDEFSADPAAKSLSTNGLQQLFGLIDSNGDGSISSTESSAFLDQIRQAVSNAGGAPQGPPPGAAAGAPGGAGSDAISQLLAASSSGDTDSDDPYSNSKTSAGSTSSTSSKSPLDLLLAAANAYSSGTQQPDLVSMLSGLLQTAA